MATMRADRLLTLLMLLQTQGKMTAAELADRLEVSTRTVYRDMDALSAAGIPVYAERGPGGGCVLMDSYRTTLTGLKEEEVKALFAMTVSGLLADLGVAQASRQARLKVLASLPPHLQEDAISIQARLHLDPAGWFHPAEPVPYLPLVQEAVWQARRLRMAYRMSDGAWIRLLLEPYGLVAKAGVWYMVACSGGAMRVYRVSRIQEAALAEGAFARQVDFNLAAFWQAWRTRFEERLTGYEVSVWVRSGAAPQLVQAFGEGMVALLANAELPAGGGEAVISLTFASAEEACRELMGLGTAVEVLSPAALRMQMRRQALALAALYR